MLELLEGGDKNPIRLIHPKWPGDLDVSGEEIVKALKAKQGFEEELLRHENRDAA